MAVVCDALSVVVRVWTLDRQWPGGADGYRALVPNASFCSDGVLTRVGFTTPTDVLYWVSQLEDQGLVFIVDAIGRAVADDVVVIDQTTGPTAHCDWVTTEVRAGVRWAWQSGRDPGELVGPSGWTAQASASMKFHPNEEADTTPWDQEDGMLMTIDPDTGKTMWMATPFDRPRTYDELTRRARRSLDRELTDAAYEDILLAQQRRALTAEDQVLAARICSRLAQELDERQGQARRAGMLWMEAARRWHEATMLGTEPDDAEEWYQRAKSEFRAGDIPAAHSSARRSIATGGRYPELMLLTARIARARGRSIGAVLTLTARAWDLAERQGDVGLVDEILEFRENLQE